MKNTNLEKLKLKPPGKIGVTAVNSAASFAIQPSMTGPMTVKP